MKIEANFVKAYQLLHKGILALAKAERQGIRIDVDYCEKKTIHLSRRIKRLETQVKATDFFKRWRQSAGGRTINIYSEDQLAAYLYKVLKLKPSKTTKSGKGSTDEEALRLLNIPELDILLQIRKLQRIRDTYLGSFMREQVNGYIHPFFNLHLVKTFRGSSDSPNFQNIPKRNKEAMQICRQALYARPGHQLMEVDYSGIEVRIAAAYHQDPTMLDYLINKKDMHADMAAQIFKIKNFDKSRKDHAVLRQAAKNGFVFPEFYGDYYKNCASNLACHWGQLPEGKWKAGQGIELNGAFLSDHLIKQGLKSLDMFVEHIREIEDDFWENRFRIYKRWKDRWWRSYQKQGYINTLTGFRCSGEMSKNDVTNYPVQGAAFHCLLWSLIRITEVSQEENWKTKIIGQIHDAIVFDLHPEEKEYVIKTVRKIMCEDLVNAYPWINVPLEVDVELTGVDESWAEIKNYKA